MNKCISKYINKKVHRYMYKSVIEAEEEEDKKSI